MGAIAGGVRLGLTAGLLVGGLGAVERIWALRALLRGAGEGAWLASLIVFFPMLVGALLGLAGGACVAIAVAARRAIPLSSGAWRALWGAALGVALAGWGVFALTLTTRFDGVVARWPVLLAAGSVAGVLGGLVAPRLQAMAEHGIARTAAACLVGAGMLVIHVVNAYFAPQSSYGIHVALVTALGSCATLAVRLLPRGVRHRAGAAAALLLVLLAVPADLAMRTRPRLEYLVKVRTSTATRCVDLLSWLMDWDRDGWAPAFLVGGEDMAPFDPARPPPVLPRASRPHEPEGGAERAAAEVSTSNVTPPHILLFTLDACRADVVSPTPPVESFLGPLRPATPHLDSLAAHSAQFDAAYAPSAGTEDTFNSLFSGELPPGNLLGIDPGRYLARRLERRGYAVRAWVDEPHFARSPWGFPAVDALSPADAPRMMVEAAEFLGGLPSGRPGFVWIHVMDLHSEVLNPFSIDAYARSLKMRAYGAALGRVDSLVGMLLDALRENGAADRTMIAVSADHGEEFGEHGHFHHNLALYEPAIRVPLWLCGPGIEPRALGATTSLEDLYPTLLETAGIDPGSTAGRSLWPLLSGAASGPDREAHYSFLPQRGFSRRFAGWARPERGQAALIDPRAGRKVILRIRSEAWEAYDLKRDPGERDNLAGDGLPWADSMLVALRAEVARQGQPLEWPSPPPFAAPYPGR